MILKLILFLGILNNVSHFPSRWFEKVYFCIEIKHQMKNVNRHFGASNSLRNPSAISRDYMAFYPRNHSEHRESYKTSNAVALMPSTWSKMSLTNINGILFHELSHKVSSHQTDICRANIIGIYLIFWSCTKHISSSRWCLPLEVSSYYLEIHNFLEFPHAFWFLLK